MFRLFFVAILFGLIFWLARSWGGERSEENKAQELVQDALTGIYFPKNTAVKVIRGGETLHFSTVENRDRFLNLHR